MQGYVKLETLRNDGDDQGLCAEVRLINVGVADKVLLMHTLKEALEMSKEEFMLYVVAEDTNVFDKSGSSSVKIKIPTKGVSGDEG